MIAQCREVLPIHPLSEEAMTDDLKKLYEQVDELRAIAIHRQKYSYGYGDVFVTSDVEIEAYSRVLGLINTMLAGWEDAKSADVDKRGLRSRIYNAISMGVSDDLPMPEIVDDVLAAIDAGQPTHRYTAAEIEERLATVGSHPHGDARDLQMLRQVCEERRHFADKCDPKRYIKLSQYEIQSGMDRVRWAEGLIKQLPEDHDGRNSWLLNYGAK